MLNLSVRITNRTVRCPCADHVKRGTVSVSGSGVEPGLYSPCQHERKSDVNIDEMIAERGFGFHTKVK